jgi:hypothetical protein
MPVATDHEPAPPPAQGVGGFQHAPVLMESTMALTESAGALIASVPLPRQHEDTIGATRPPLS